jgi:hypothetical protein
MQKIHALHEEVRVPIADEKKRQVWRDESVN